MEDLKNLESKNRTIKRPETKIQSKITYIDEQQPDVDEYDFDKAEETARRKLGLSSLKTESYTKKQRARREQQEREKLESMNHLLLEYMKFYKKNAPETVSKIDVEDFIDDKRDLVIFSEKKKNLAKEIIHTREIIISESFKEKELIDIYNVLQFSKKEYRNEKGVRDVKDHYTCIMLEGLIKKRIPDFGKQQDFAEILKNISIKCRKVLSDQEFEILNVKLYDEELTENELTETKNHVCEICGFRARKGSGLSSHRRNKHPKEKVN